MRRESGTRVSPPGRSQVVEEMEKSSPHHTTIGTRSRTHHHVQNPQYFDVRCGPEAGCDRAEPLPLKSVSSEGRGRTAHRGRLRQPGSYKALNYHHITHSNVRPVGLAAAANVLEGPGRTLHLRKALQGLAASGHPFRVSFRATAQARSPCSCRKCVPLGGPEPL